MADTFPITERYIYLNHTGVAPTSLPHTKFNERFPRSHNWGWMALKKFRLCSQSCTNAVKLISAITSSEIAFTNSTTQDLILVVNGMRQNEGDNIITMEAEFLADICPWWSLKEFGVEACIVPETKGVRQHQ